MIVKELIKLLNTFNKEHNVRLEVVTDSGYLTVASDVEDVQFKNGQCFLVGTD